MRYFLFGAFVNLSALLVTFMMPFDNAERVYIALMVTIIVVLVTFPLGQGKKSKEIGYK